MGHWRRTVGLLWNYCIDVKLFLGLLCLRKSKWTDDTQRIASVSLVIWCVGFKSCWVLLMVWVGFGDVSVGWVESNNFALNWASKWLTSTCPTLTRRSTAHVTAKIGKDKNQNLCGNLFFIIKNLWQKFDFVSIIKIIQGNIIYNYID